MLPSVSAQTAKATTLPGFVSAIADWTRRQWAAELPRGRVFETVMVSLRKLHGDQTTGTPKDVLTLDDLRAIHSHLGLRYLEHARDWCACLVDFCGTLPAAVLPLPPRFPRPPSHPS